MSKLVDDIAEGLENAIAYVRGDRKGTHEHVVHVPLVDVKSLRQRLGMTQREFAQRFAFSIRSVQNWEQGRRIPEGPAKVLLTVIDREPRAVLRAMGAAESG
ncbi:MAG TPA: helix-turn-helix domain-containing protein [Thermoanaerobaculia bacterium]|jgi:putative transcriptional regulator